MSEAAQDPVKALTPEDRAWLEQQGWQEPPPYPVIGTGKIREK